MRRSLVPVLLGVTLLSAAAAAFTLRGGQSVDLSIALGSWEGRFQECLTEQPEAKASQCLQDLSKTAARAGQIGPALSVLREGMTKNTVLAGKCHAAVHTVGQEAVRHDIGLYETYRIEFPDCRFGFYHGALEAHTAALDLAALKAELPQLCAPFGDETQEAAGECVHVLGHFIFERVRPELTEGLQTCQLIESARLQGRCIDGVLMQSVDLIKPAVKDPDHERYPLLVAVWGEGREQQLARARSICETFNGQEVAAYTCNTNIPQALAVLWQGDYPALHEVCEAVENSGYRQACFEGIAASGFSLLDWEERKIVEACHAGDHPDTKFCIGTLAFSYVLSTTPERGAAICKLVREYEKETCEQRVREGLQVRESISGEVATLADDDHGIYSE